MQQTQALVDKVEKEKLSEKIGEKINDLGKAPEYRKRIRPTDYDTHRKKTLKELGRAAVDCEFPRLAKAKCLPMRSKSSDSKARG
jgi:hypothetical protein